MRKFGIALALAVATLFGAARPALAANEGDVSEIVIYDGDVYYIECLVYQNGQWVIVYEFVCLEPTCGAGKPTDRAK